MTGRRRAKRDGNPTASEATLLGAPVDALVGRHFIHFPHAKFLPRGSLTMQGESVLQLVPRNITVLPILRPELWRDGDLPRRTRGNGGTRELLAYNKSGVRGTDQHEVGRWLKRAAQRIFVPNAPILAVVVIDHKDP